MQRSIVYPSEQPTTNTWLGAEKAKMIALGYLSQGILGTSTVVDGLLCTPTSPASLAVLIGSGSIYQLEPVDSTAYGTLALDTTDQIIKQGISIGAPTSLTLTPPGVSGQAINYLIEASLSETDTGSTVLSYFNSAQPTIPFSGPGGSGVSQPVFRDCLITIVAKAGVAATAGSQVTPAADPGYVPLWIVTVANGATQLTSAQIVQSPIAPFISVKLPQVPTWVQGGTWDWAVDTGTANAAVVTLTPVPTSPLTAGMRIFMKKIAAANTGGMTINVNGLGAIAIIHNDGSPLNAADAAASYRMDLAYDGTSFIFLNAPIATAVGGLTASAGEGIAVSGGAVVSLNFPGLSTETNLGLTDLWAFYSNIDLHHRVLTWAQFLAALKAALGIPSFNFQSWNLAGVYTYTPNAASQHGLAFATGSGGGGGGAIGAGGSSGATAITFLPSLTTLSPQTVTIAAGGAGGPSSGDGAPGGITSLGALAVAGGGLGGYSNGTGRSSGVAGGVGITGTLLLNGNASVYGAHDSPNSGGIAAGSFWGGGGVGSDSLGRFGPGPGAVGGGGGGGYFAGQAGGKGGDGVVVVLEF